MYIKITTSCNFAGSETEHYLEVPDDTSDNEIEDLVQNFVEDDIQPEGSYNVLDEEEVEEALEDGYVFDEYTNEDDEDEEDEDSNR